MQTHTYHCLNHVHSLLSHPLHCSFDVHCLLSIHLVQNDVQSNEGPCPSHTSTVKCSGGSMLRGGHVLYVSN